MTRRADERGSMAVEVVLLAPLFVGFLLLVVAGGRFVTVQSDIEAAARDAVRAASYERDAASAVSVARSVAAQGLSGGTTCAPAALSGAFEAGGTITVTLDCTIDLGGLGLIGLPGAVDIDADSSAPLDLFRRTS